MGEELVVSGELGNDRVKVLSVWKSHAAWPARGLCVGIACGTRDNCPPSLQALVPLGA
jgi:hypothetical protein